MPVGSNLYDPSHEVRRVVDRLSVVAPRLSPSERDAVQEFLQWLADAAADGSGREGRRVPRIRAHGLADQVVVLARDALCENEGVGESLAQQCAALRRAL